MSAFLVNDHHINSLLTYANRERLYFWNNTTNQRADFAHVDELQHFAEVLQAENLRSLNARYGDPVLEPSINFEFVYQLRLSPVEVIKACDCYDYQACETADYRQTLAADIIDLIRTHAIRALPGYDEADWELRSYRIAV